MIPRNVMQQMAGPKKADILRRGTASSDLVFQYVLDNYDYSPQRADSVKLTLHLVPLNLLLDFHGKSLLFVV